MTQNLIAEFRHAAIANTLRQCPLFIDISPDHLEDIASITISKLITRGKYLFLENSPMAGFYVVQQGAIKLHRLNLKGQEQVFHVFRAPESFGEEMIFSESGYPADASAVEDSQILLIQKNAFLALLKNHPALEHRLLRSAGERVRSLMGLLDDLTLKDASTRLANWLISHCPNPNSAEPQKIELQMTKHLLALELGLASETLSRTFKKFRSQHLVNVQGRALTLPCPTRLAEFVRLKNDAVENSWENRCTVNF